MVLGVLAMVAAAVTGLADYAEVDGNARSRATVHGTLMVITLVLYLVTLGMRAGSPADRLVPIAIALVAYLDPRALLGDRRRPRLPGRDARGPPRLAGDGHEVDRPRSRRRSPDIPEGGPTKLRLGINELAVVRNGEQILAVHAQCAHAGGPLAEGSIVDGQIQCPWHGSRFRLENGHVSRGPAMYDQPAYEVRRAEAGGWEGRRVVR